MVPKRSTLAADLECLQTCDDRGNYSFRFYYHHSVLEKIFLGGAIVGYTFFSSISAHGRNLLQKIQFLNNFRGMVIGAIDKASTPLIRSEAS